MNEIPAQFAPDFEALKRKKAAELSGGFFRAGMQVHRNNASRYRVLVGVEEDTRLSMACLQAVLALLSRHVTSMHVRPPSQQRRPLGQFGVVQVLSLSSSARFGMSYRLTWSLSLDGQEATYGGFSYGSTTFHLPLVHLIACLSTTHVPALAAQGQEHEEVLKRWGELLRLCERQTWFTSTDMGQEWRVSQVEQACRIPAMQDALERVCDALWFDLRYLPTGARRAITLMRDPAIINTSASLQTVVPSDLLIPPVLRRRRQQRLEGRDAPQPFRLEQRLDRLRGDDPLPDEEW